MAPPMMPDTPKRLKERRYRARHRERIRSRNRRDNLWRQYRLTIDQYDEMNYQQDGKCLVCGLPDLKADGSPRDVKLPVDHCHDCMEVRGLLCSLCNHAIGFLKDDPVRISKALAYVEKHLAGERHQKWLEGQGDGEASAVA